MLRVVHLLSVKDPTLNLRLARSKQLSPLSQPLVEKVTVLEALDKLRSFRRLQKIQIVD